MPIIALPVKTCKIRFTKIPTCLKDSAVSGRNENNWKTWNSSGQIFRVTSTPACRAFYKSGRNHPEGFHLHLIAGVSGADSAGLQTKVK